MTKKEWKAQIRLARMAQYDKQNNIAMQRKEYLDKLNILVNIHNDLASTLNAKRQAQNEIFLSKDDRFIPEEKQSLYQLPV